MPDSVSVPVPSLTSEPPIPAMTPLTSVDRLLPPAVSSLAPSWKAPAPAIEPTVWLKPLRSSVPPLATVNADVGLNAFTAPALNVPAFTVVAPV